MPTYFTLTALVGIVLTLLGFVTAPLVASFYHEPRLTPILQVLSSTLAVASFQSVSNGILSKHFRFRELTMIEMASTVTAGVIGVTMAWRGFGVWSLVTNLVLSYTIQAVLLWHFVPPKFSLHLRSDVLPRLLRYGVPLTAASVLHQFYDNADYLVVGKMAGAMALGHYTLAFRLATLAHEKIAVVINRVAFPSFAAMQDNLERLVAHWFAVSRAVSLINFPLLLLLLVNAQDFILVVFGEKWLPAVVPLRFLCLVGVLRSLVHIILHIFSALGRTGLRLQFGIVNAVLMPASFIIGCKLAGLAGVGIAWCVTYPIIWIFVLLKVKTLVPFSLLEYFSNLRFPLLVTVVCFVAMLPANWIQDPVFARLCARVILGLAGFGICVLSQRSLREHLRAIVTRASNGRSDSPSQS